VAALSSSATGVPIASAATTTAVAATTAAAAPKSRKMIYAAAGAVVAVAVAVGAYLWSTRPRGFNLQNMRLTQVTTSGNAGDAALSPDGRYIVYVLRDGALESLWVQNLASGSNVQILPPEQARFVAATFTPDGNYVMFVRSDKSTTNFRYLYQMPVLGGTPRQLVRDVDSAPAFSPDGKHIAYVRGVVSPPANQILVANADGSDERVLMRRASFSAGFPTVAWSPDGKTLVMTSPETRGDQNLWILLAIAAHRRCARTTFVHPTHAHSGLAAGWPRFAGGGTGSGKRPGPDLVCDLFERRSEPLHERPDELQHLLPGSDARRQLACGAAGFGDERCVAG